MSRNPLPPTPASEPSPDDAPVLAPPGAGVPAYQRWVGRYVFLPVWCLRLSPRRVPDSMERQADRLFRSAAGLTHAQRVRRVLVRPQIGLEDSSRYHSWAMVVEHLTIIGGALADVVLELTHRRVPGGKVSTAALKPRGGIDAAQAEDGYRRMLQRFRRVILEECDDWRSPTLYPHPWFGPLDARQWVCFAPFHQTIHLKQARRIRRRVLRDDSGRGAGTVTGST